ncbi:MAG: hypothetical protein FJX46_11965 [Alphaproteobacteria bacterium]|nr:hypothetical protein [Alphaproteobacteria bacterium]
MPPRPGGPAPGQQPPAQPQLPPAAALANKRYAPPGATPAGPEPEIGHALKPYSTVITRERRDKCLGAAEIDPRLFGDLVEPALIANEAFRAIKGTGFSIDGYLHAESRFVMTEALPVDNVLALKGRIAAKTATSRGPRVVYAFDLLKGNGGALGSLTVDVVISGGQAPPRDPGAAAGAPAADATAGYRQVGSKQVTPNRVDNYSRYVGNQIHFDPLFASRHGYKEPLAQGLMQLSWMMAALAAGAKPPAAFDLTIRFPRPLFWSEAATIWRAGGGTALRCLNPARKVTADAVFADYRT